MENINVINKCICGAKAVGIINASSVTVACTVCPRHVSGYIKPQVISRWNELNKVPVIGQECADLLEDLFENGPDKVQE